jgi:TatD family-associated radical SAM protein
MSMSESKKPAIVYSLGDRLYLNITNQCSSRCWFCFRNYRSGVGGYNLKFSVEPQASEVILALENALCTKRWSEVVFCGFGEPTARLDVLLQAARWIREHYPGVPIRLDTNGHGYALNRGREVVEELKAAGVERVSVSLNGFDAETYNQNCRPTIEGAFETVLDFISKAKEELDVEVSAIRMPEVDVAKVKAIADGLGVAFRVRDYIPCFW